jgi:energy-coupling factor transporter ATP-binding protein EcfA2
MYVCPKCLKVIENEEDHANCELSLHAESLSKSKPTWIALTGFTGHGKTTLLESMLELLKRMPSRLPKFAMTGTDIYTQGQLLRIPRGTLPEATEELPVPLLLDCFDMPSAGLQRLERRSLYLFDTPGEHFDLSLGSAIENLTTVFEQAACPWLLYTLSREQDASTKHRPLGELLGSVITRFREKRLSVKGKTFIIVYTKASDLLEDFPPEIQDYLMNDPFFGPDAMRCGTLRDFDLADYMRQASKISALLKELTGKYANGGSALLRLAEDNEIELKFCITESIGHHVGDGNLHDDRSPRRVLDPLFWTIYLSSQVSNPIPVPQRKSVAVLIDPRIKTESFWYRDGGLKQLWLQMQKRVDLTFYFLGREQVEIMPPGEPPTAPPATTYAPLLAPILKRIPHEQTIWVLSNLIPKDIHDFEFDRDSERFIVLVTEESARDLWNRTAWIRNPGDFEALYSQIHA